MKHLGNSPNGIILVEFKKGSRHTAESLRWVGFSQFVKDFEKATTEY